MRLRLKIRLVQYLPMLWNFRISHGEQAPTGLCYVCLPLPAISERPKHYIATWIKIVSNLGENAFCIAFHNKSCMTQSKDKSHRTMGHSAVCSLRQHVALIRDWYIPAQFLAGVYKQVCGVRTAPSWSWQPGGLALAAAYMAPWRSGWLIMLLLAAPDWINAYAEHR